MIQSHYITQYLKIILHFFLLFRWMMKDFTCEIYTREKSPHHQFYVQRNTNWNTTNTPTTFQITRLNIRNAMNMGMGVFKVPKAGTYAFALSFLKVMLGQVLSYGSGLMVAIQKLLMPVMQGHSIPVPYKPLLNLKWVMKSLWCSKAERSTTTLALLISQAFIQRKTLSSLDSLKFAAVS